jgi:hypothetical protein
MWITVRSQPKQIIHETLFRKYLTQKGLVEWLKELALSSSPRGDKKKKKTRFSEDVWHHYLDSLFGKYLYRRKKCSFNSTVLHH